MGNHSPPSAEAGVTGNPLPAVLRPDQLPVTERGGGARTVPLVTAALGSKEMLNGITSFQPGAAIPLHAHNCEESVIILEGSAVFELDGVEHELKRYDTTWIQIGRAS